LKYIQVWISIPIIKSKVKKIISYIIRKIFGSLMRSQIVSQLNIKSFNITNNIPFWYNHIAAIKEAFSISVLLYIILYTYLWNTAKNLKQLFNSLTWSLQFFPAHETFAWKKRSTGFFVVHDPIRIWPTAFLFSPHPLYT